MLRPNLRRFGMNADGMPSDDCLLESVGIGKSYGRTVALDDISLKIKSGSIHGLLGENGAGKSTFLKILAGVTHADKGELYYKGEELRLKKPREAVGIGLVSVFQELSLVPDLKVAEVLFLEDPPCNFLGKVDQKCLHADARRLLDQYGFEDIPTNSLVKDLSLADRQVVEIVKCLHCSPEILFMDEGTSTLTAREVEIVFDLLNELKNQGKSVVFISHRMEEIKEICDTYTVFRDGRNMGTFNKEDITDEQLIELMVGELNSDDISRANPPADEVLMDVRNLSWENSLKDITFQLRKGEIFGIGGLNGQGQTELLYSLFGVLKAVKGEVSINGERVHIANPAKAISRKYRIALIPEDRKTEGGVLGMSIQENLKLAVNNKGFSGMKAGELLNDMKDVFDKLKIKAPGLDSSLSSLSGGNQQKVIIGKWLLTDADIYIFHDPTRGIDIKAKHDIYRLIEELADRGKAVLLFSTELQELTRLCHRVAVLYEHHIRKVLEGDDLNEKSLVETSLAMDKEGGSL